MTKEEVYNFIISDDGKNGSLKRESIFKKQFPDVYEEFLNTHFIPEIEKLTFRVKLWHFLRDIYYIPKCKVCGNPVKFNNSGKFEYSIYCSSKCCNGDSDFLKKKRESYIEHYGCDNPMKNNSVKNKSKQTCIERYGVDNYSKTDECKNKVRESFLTHYGVDNYSKTDECKGRVRDTNNNKYGYDYYSQTDEYKGRIKEVNLEKFGVESYFQTDEYKEKSKQTCIERYGVDNYSKTDECKERVRDTNNNKFGYDYYSQTGDYKKRVVNTSLKKFGVNNYSQTDEYKEKSKQTCLEKYGCDNYSQTDEYKGRIKEVNLEKFGVESYFQSGEYKELCLKKFGVENYSQTDEWREKTYETKKRNHTFNTSKVEQDFKKYLSENHIDFIFQYKSDEYPFNCDFYIPKYDLYIEIQGSWTHGGKPFDINNCEDVNILNRLKHKDSKYYKNAIEVWTIRDVIKRQTAKDNNLNWIEVFSSDVNDVIESFINTISKL